MPEKLNQYETELWKIVEQYHMEIEVKCSMECGMTLEEAMMDWDLL